MRKEGQGKKDGFIMLEVVLALIMLGLAAYGMAITMNSTFATQAAVRTASQAQQYAEIDADLVKLISYEYLDDSAVFAEYGLHKARGAMNNVTDGNGWEDEIIVSGEKTSSYDSDMKYRIATINIYRTSDTVPRATIEVPLAAYGSGGVPVGSIMAWPLDSMPTGSGVWLECDGSEVPAKYTALRKIMTRTPDYRGVFLRGYGSRTFSQNNGTNTASSTTYSSGAVGAIQGDATRRDYGYIGDLLGTVKTSYGAGGPPNGDSYGNMTLWAAQLVKWSYSDLYVTYQLSGSSDSGYDLIEYQHNDDRDIGLQDSSVNHGTTAVFVGWDNKLVCPVDNEIRPINTAVKFLVKAR